MDGGYDMSAIDEFPANNEVYAGKITKGSFPVHDMKSGQLREAT